MTRKTRILLAGFVGVLAVIVFISKRPVSKAPVTHTVAVNTEVRVPISDSALKKLVFLDSFEQLYPDPVFEHLKIPGSYGKYGADNTCGKLVRVLRFQNVSLAVEARYDNLPKNLLLAMMMEESTGMDVFPNAKDDGGQGLIHSQPGTAHDFSLKTYDDCKKMVCKKHGKELREHIEDEEWDRKSLIAYDDRLHPIKNIDAAARMIAYGMQLSPIKGLSPLQSAIRRYSGKKNYAKYWSHIVTNMAYLDDPTTLAKVEEYFNRSSPDLVINGTRGGFSEYIRVSQEQNLNYGLADYEKLPRYTIRHSDPKSFEKYVEPRKKSLPRLDCK